MCWGSSKASCSSMGRSGNSSRVGESMFQSRFQSWSQCSSRTSCTNRISLSITQLNLPRFLRDSIICCGWKISCISLITYKPVLRFLCQSVLLQIHALELSTCRFCGFVNNLKELAELELLVSFHCLEQYVSVGSFYVLRLILNLSSYVSRM